MASILPVGSRWRAQVRKRGQSIAKTFKTESAAEAWAREKEVEIDKGHNAVDAATVTVGELVRKCRQARADSKRAVWCRNRTSTTYCSGIDQKWPPWEIGPRP